MAESADVQSVLLNTMEVSQQKTSPNVPIAKHSKPYQEFVCGWGAAFINITTTFPINKVMFRQMLHGVDTQLAVKQLKKEGVRYLYRGCLLPLTQKTICVSLMFGTYQSYGDFIQRCFPIVPMPLSLGIAAICAGTTEALLTPLERVQTLLQDRYYNSKFKNTFHAFVDMRQHGVKEYYRGLTPILMRNGPSTLLFFGLRNKAEDYLPEAESWIGRLVKDFITGSLIGAFISTLCYPVNVVKTKMQVCYGTRFVSFPEACKLTYIERGRSVKKMFLGVHVNYTRAFLSWGIMNASYGLLKKAFFSES